MILSNKSLGIKEWKADDKPREKLMSKGKEALSDAELLAILIGSGNREENAVSLCQRILGSVNHNLLELGKLGISDLMKFKGIGEAKALSIITALELGRRRRLEDALVKANISSSKDVFELMQPIIGELELEEFWIVFLNNSNKVLSKQKISSGGITGTVVDVRLVFKMALELFSTAIILCHNHPSGGLKPSQADINLTQKITEAGKVLDIKVLDHLIISGNHFYSFADEGRI
ncbi:RadC family protein [Namhaeicola litoreus]|uniref:DNA repair protein RadC n=1 Tax=Namhaeicola litoreus TaxID=1052145 RepID=A0ABW3Y4H2_9FLAO